MNGDTKKSIDYLKQSAKLGFMKAEEALGAAYMNGDGVSKNLAQAKKWLKEIELLGMIKKTKHGHWEKTSLGFVEDIIE